MDLSERAARNEEIFRGINERIDEGAGAHDVAAPLPFHCECGRGTCTETIEIAPPEYDEIAAHPHRFIVAPGHELPEVERIVSERETYLVVEKVGEAAEELEHDHPRERHA